MNESLQKTLSLILERAIAGFDKGVDFMSEQLPDVVHQYLVWSLTSYIVLLVAALAAIGLLWFVALVLVEQPTKLPNSTRYTPWGDPKTGATVAAGFGSAICLIPTGIAVYHILLIWLAPKVFLIKTFATLIR